MSKVSASSASSADVIAQLKDQYELRNRESEARHRDEMRELREANHAELEKTLDGANKRIQELQEENSAKLSQKDLQYQKEIEALKALYAKRASEGKKPT